MGLFKKNESTEYILLNNYSLFLNNLLSLDEYISRKKYIDNYQEINKSINELKLMDEKGVLISWCKMNKTDYKKLSELIVFYDHTFEEIKNHNEKFINKHLRLDKYYLDNILKDDDPNIKLDDDQRRVVLSDEDYTLVIAGAGAGKTTTIEAKVKYLVDKKDIDPNRILIVSFTKKATGELIERFKRLNIPVHISTFHSIGNTLIKENDGKKHKIVEQGFMYKVINEYLISKLNDEYFIKKIILFLSSYLNMPFNSDDFSLFYKSLSSNITTLKSDMINILNDYYKEQTLSKITINEERVRSIEECNIANFLYINGIDYEYEPVYQYGFENTTKPYCPDFLIKYEDKQIYLEHFGISQDGINNRYSAKEIEIYKKHVNEKVLLHKKHGTKLIYTFSKYNDGRDLITHLQENLINLGIEFNKKDDIAIYRKLINNAEEKYFSKLIILICNFIHRFKVCNYDLNTKFDEWQYSTKSERTKLFLEITKRCFHIYESKRLEENAIDFEDMINDAVNILDKRIEEKDLLPYDYILVDEYQDISIQRFDLCDKLSKASNAKIIAVGDDWQSIYRFSGAKIDLFTNFKNKMGYANILKITKTYRNSQQLIDIAGKFVMENDKQIKKELKSTKSIEDPIILMSYDDSYNRDKDNHGILYRISKTIELSLDDIVKKYGTEKSVLLIGRYNFDGKNLTKSTDFFYYDNGMFKSKKYPNLKINFMTAHSSKGLGSDNVIIINAKDEILGFPSKIEDDPVMKLVIKEDEDIDYEEERRLFYVALTRTKNRVYIITPQNKPSKFVMEIKEKNNNIVLSGNELTPIQKLDIKYKCPICGYPLQKRESKLKFSTTNKQLWICSNEPEVCGFLTNNLNGNAQKLSISKCPSCYDGYLVVKRIINKESSNGLEWMLGCTNYKTDGKGCNFSMFGYNFTQDKSEIIVNEDGKLQKTSLKKEINMMLESILLIYKKNSKFLFGYKQLVDFLSGKNDKVIEIFGLDKENGYGMFSDKKEYFIPRLISILVDLNVIEKIKTEKGYFNYLIKQTELSESQIITIDKQMR